MDDEFGENTNMGRESRSRSRQYEEAGCTFVGELSTEFARANVYL